MPAPPPRGTCRAPCRHPVVGERLEIAVWRAENVVVTHRLSTFPAIQLNFLPGVLVGTFLTAWKKVLSPKVNWYRTYSDQARACSSDRPRPSVFHDGAEQRRPRIRRRFRPHVVVQRLHAELVANEREGAGLLVVDRERPEAGEGRAAHPQPPRPSTPPAAPRRRSRRSTRDAGGVEAGA